MVLWEEDSNWKEVRIYGWDKAIGIKRDGSLWQLQSLSPPWQTSTWLLSRKQPSQYSDWLTVCPDQYAFLAFAGDGGLCVWGDPVYGCYEFNAPDPQRLLLPSRLKARRIAMIAW